MGNYGEIKGKFEVSIKLFWIQFCTITLTQNKYDNIQVAVVMLGALAVGTIIGYGAAITNIFSGKSEIRSLKSKNKHF